MSEVNFLLNIVGIVTAIAAVVYAYFKWSYKYWERRGLPYLEPSFPFGNVDSPWFPKMHVGQQLASWYNTFKEQGHRHGGTYSLLNPKYIPVDPEIIKCILSKDFQYFVDRRDFDDEKDSPIEAHLFRVGGAKWKNLRTKLTPTFTSGKMKQMFETIIECGHSLQSAMEDRVKAGGVEIDIKEYLASYSLDIIGSCAFGLEFNAIKDPASPFRHHAKLLTYPTLKRSLRGFIRNSSPALARILGLQTFDVEATNFFVRLVEDTVKFRETTQTTRHDFMQLLVNLKNNGPGMKIEEIAANTLLFFIAGFETSSTAMSFCLYELCKQPHIQKRVRKEIRDVLERHEGVLSYEAVGEMKYLAQVFDETLRMYPSLALLNRICTKDYKIPDSDVVIERGIEVLIPVVGLHHDPDHFPEPLKFDPERFSDENKGKIKQFTYLPFGDGPRNCIGLRFGLLQSKVGLAFLLRDFEFSLSPKTITPITMNPRGLFVSVVGGLWLDAKRAA